MLYGTGVLFYFINHSIKTSTRGNLLIAKREWVKSYHRIYKLIIEKGVTLSDKNSYK